jgi:uncharacterized protein YceH (UPF0502 family)
MIGNLSAEAIRVLGAMIEKELSTPEYYPLTLNALKTACNQKSNRFPVVSYSESDIVRALDELEKWRLIGHVSGAGSRSQKFQHAAAQAMELSQPETAVMACLFLRGAQTPGEIKGRTGRLYPFESLADVDATLSDLQAREESLVASVARRPGQKEDRFVHLVGAEDIASEDVNGQDDAGNLALPDGSAGASISAAADVDAELHQQVLLLRDELDRLRAEFDAFREQFD